MKLIIYKYHFLVYLLKIIIFMTLSLGLSFQVDYNKKMGNPDKIYDVIIIGSGPAGLSAAIYTIRFGLETLMISGFTWGGQLMTTTLVENYPGFPEGINGPDLMRRMLNQAIRFGVEFVDYDAEKLENKEGIFNVFAGGKWYKGKTVIIATGARYRELGLESEKRLLGRGVSYCAVCDGYFFKDKDVAVVGGGDTALTDALYLADIVKKVYIVHRRDKFRASDILVDEVSKRNNIEVLWNRQVLDILGDKRVEGLKLYNKLTSKEEVLKVDGVFIAIGHIPNTELVKGLVELTESGYIKTHDFVKTNVPGLFAAGDVMDPKYQQAVTAAAFGVMAAIEAKEYIDRFWVKR